MGQGPQHYAHEFRGEGGFVPRFRDARRMRRREDRHFQSFERHDRPERVEVPYRPLERESQFDYGLAKATGPAHAEIAQIPSFPSWLRTRIERNAIPDLQNTPAIAKEYENFRSMYAVDAAEAFYRAHRHEEWFRQKYDPIRMLSFRKQQQHRAEKVAEELFAAVGNGSILSILPQVGGAYTGWWGLGLGVQEAQIREHITALLHSPVPFNIQAPTLFIRDIPAFVSIERVKHMIERFESYEPFEDSRDGSEHRVIAPTDVQIHRAMQAAADDLIDKLRAANVPQNVLRHFLPPSETTDAPENQNENEDDPSLQTARELAEILGIPLPLTRDAYAQLLPQLPRPVLVEHSNPVRCPGAGYRSNLWVQYASLGQAALARQLLRRFVVNAVETSVHASYASLKDVRHVMGSLQLLDEYAADAERSAQELLDRLPVNAPEALTGLAKESIATVDISPVTRGLLQTKQGAVLSADWHMPTYGRFEKFGNKDATWKTFPYGRKNCSEIPSWASLEGQVLSDLNLALKIISVLDKDLMIFEAHTQIGSPSSEASEQSSSSILPGLSAETDSRFYRTLQSVLKQNESIADSETGSKSSSPAFNALNLLDIAIAYLRHVHCYDFYSGTRRDEPGDLRQSIGDGYKRIPTPTRRREGGEPSGERNTVDSAAEAAADASKDVEDFRSRQEEEHQLDSFLNEHDGDEGDMELGEKYDAENEEADEREETGVDDKSSQSGVLAVAEAAGADKEAETATQPFTTVHNITERAEKAYQDWKKRHEDRVQGLLRHIQSSIALNQKQSIGDDDTYSRCQAPVPADAGAPRIATMDGLFPFESKTSALIHWKVITAAKDALEQTVDRILAQIPRPIVLRHIYGQNLHIDGSSKPAAKQLDSDAQSSQETVALLRHLVSANSTVEAHTQCLPCERNNIPKSFKDPQFAAKHLESKHPDLVNHGYDAELHKIKEGIEFALSDMHVMRKAYFSDPRRPMPWHHPQSLREIEEDSTQSIQYLLQEKNLRMSSFAQALGNLVNDPSVGLLNARGMDNDRGRQRFMRQDKQDRKQPRSFDHRPGSQGPKHHKYGDNHEGKRPQKPNAQPFQNRRNRMQVDPKRVFSSNVISYSDI